MAVAIIWVIRQWFVGSYRISTKAMEQTVLSGDFVLVNKLPSKGNPGRNRVVLFSGRLPGDSIRMPLMISRCVGMPGDTICVEEKEFCVNGRILPFAPQSLHTWEITLSHEDNCLKTLQTLRIPLREWKQDKSGYTLRLTSYEAWKVKEEMGREENLLQCREEFVPYTLVIPQKGRAYRLDETSLLFCREAILNETDGKAVFRNGKLFIDGKETTFFFFENDYYWMLSDNPEEAVDSRHLGIIARDRIVGNVWLSWYSKDRGRIFSNIN